MRAALVALAAAVVLVAVAAPADAANTCLECHAASGVDKLRQPTKLFQNSVHQRDEIGCVGCHGGDASDPTVSAHRAVGKRPWWARPSREQIPEMCGGCHASARFVRRFNASMATDQLALFKLSHHGELALKGDERAPVCTTCHGSHDVKPSSHPDSPVRRRNVAKLCGECHSDPEKMGGTGHKTDQLAKWERSVHAQGIELPNSRAPACPQCHGSHSATPPGVASVGRVCGSCHARELANFDKGPHSRAYRKLGFEECVPCHGSHDVPAARPLSLGLGSGAACGKCHANDDRPLQVADKLNALIREGADAAAAARAAVKRGKRDGLFLPDSTTALAKLTAAEEALRPALHSLDTQALVVPVQEVVAAAAEVEELVARAQRMRSVEREGYGFGLAVLVVFFGLLVAKTVGLSMAKRRRT